MSATGRVGIDVVIFGGGAAGLWLLDDLVQAGYEPLLAEAFDLGSGQTITSQGIIHGGLKYTLGGWLTSSARSIRAMPTTWRRSLAGERRPDLRNTRLRAEFCHLWQTRSLRSRVGMVGARAGLHVAPTPLDRAARPAVLAECPGAVARLDEQVIDPASFVADLADQHAGRIIKIDLDSGLEFEGDADGTVRLIRLLDPASGTPLDLVPRRVVFTAGAGNVDLARRAGIATTPMQRRPLHMIVMRGPLPVLNGHCVDGTRTRATITTARDYADRTIWQVGGQIAEDGVDMEPSALITHARSELTAVVPGLDLEGVQWCTYRVDRAEPRGRGGRRPADPGLVAAGNTLTAWPTKLALAPRLAAMVCDRLLPPVHHDPDLADMLRHWPRPALAVPPWEEQQPWSTDV